MGRLRTLPEALAEAARTGTGYTFVTGTAASRHAALDRGLPLVRRPARPGLRRALARSGPAARRSRRARAADAEQFLTTLFGASIAGVIPASLYPPATTGDLPRYLELTTAILRAPARARS